MILTHGLHVAADGSGWTGLRSLHSTTLGGDALCCACIMAQASVRKTREAVTVGSGGHHTQSGDKVQAGVDPRFAAGLPFRVPEI